MSFITQIDYSNNRQVRQSAQSVTELSGTTIFGVSFNDLPSGINTATSGISESLPTVNGTFSGNTGATTFYFDDSRLLLGVSALIPITTSNSGTTQSTGPIFVPAISGNTNGYDTIWLYTGVSYSIYATDMADVGGGNYTGTTTSYLVKVLSAGTLDYTGSTSWLQVKGYIEADGFKLPEYTPTGSGDTSGVVGSLTFSDDFLYVKTNNGWKKASLLTI